MFKLWYEDVPFHAKELHDRRLRLLYKDRYDFRKNVIDWDYQWTIRPAASIIHIRQYREWRNTGIAFEFGDQRYSHPNRTMASYAEGKERGRSALRRGLWVDIVCSPYLSLGIHCDTPNDHAKLLFEIHNKDSGSEQHRHHAVEIAVYNILSFFYEIENGKRYRMQRAHDLFSGLGEEEQRELERANEEEEEEEEERTNKKEENKNENENEKKEKRRIGTPTDGAAEDKPFTPVEIREIDSDDDPESEDEAEQQPSEAPKPEKADEEEENKEKEKEKSQKQKKPRKTQRKRHPKKSLLQRHEHWSVQGTSWRYWRASRSTSCANPLATCWHGLNSVRRALRFCLSLGLFCPSHEE